MGGTKPKPMTCESESESDDVATEVPSPVDVTPKKRPQASSTVMARQERPASDARKPSSRSSDSGYSTGTKGSADTAGMRKPSLLREQSSMPPPEIVPPTASSTGRPSMQQRVPSSRSNGSHRSSQSAHAPSQAPSVKSRSAKSEGMMDASRPRDRPSSGAQDREELQDLEGLHRTASQRAAHTSPPSSRASRAPSRSSQEMPPPPLPRPRSISANRARPSSFHGGMGIPYDAHYANYGTPYGSYEREYGPPPARSAYVDKRAAGYPVRPALSVLPGPPAGHHDPMALQRSQYDPARMGLAHRAQTEYATASSASASQYSTRRPVTYYPDQPNGYDMSPVRSRDRSQAPSPTQERKHVSARQPAYSAVYDEPSYEQALSDSEEGSEFDDDDYQEVGGRYMPKQQTMQDRPFNAQLSARGMPSSSAVTGYGMSQHREIPDPYLEDGLTSTSDYRSSVRSKDSAGSRSTQSRRPSLASSGGVTKGTNYSASSGSGGYASQRRMSGYEQFQTNSAENVSEAERYMRQQDARATHVRHQQPEVTQESLRQHNARAIEAKRSSRASVPASSRVSDSYQSRTIRAAEEQSIRLNIDTSAGFNVELQGNTEGRPIKLVQKPGDTKAQLIIGSTDRDQTVYSGTGSSGRTNGSSSRVTGRTGSTHGAVSGRRDRSRTVPELG